MCSHICTQYQMSSQPRPDQPTQHPSAADHTMHYNGDPLPPSLCLEMFTDLILVKTGAKLLPSVL